MKLSGPTPSTNERPPDSITRDTFNSDNVNHPYRKGVVSREKKESPPLPKKRLTPGEPRKRTRCHKESLNRQLYHPPPRPLPFTRRDAECLGTKTLRPLPGVTIYNPAATGRPGAGLTPGSSLRGSGRETAPQSDPPGGGPHNS